MENAIKVKYKGALAHYRIEKNLTGSYTASLLSYEGNALVQPPTVITLHMHHDYWLGHPGDQQLVDDIGHLILE